MKHLKFYLGIETKETSYKKEIARFIVLVVGIALIIYIKGQAIDYVSPYAYLAFILAIPRILLLIKAPFLLFFSIARMVKISGNKEVSTNQNE